VPREAGGGGWSPLEFALAHEEIGAVCGNARGFLAVQSGLVATALAQSGSAAQRAAWLPRLLDGRAIGCFALTEPEAGSDVAALRCRAEPAGGGWRLRGRKIWITNGGVADVMLLFATVDPAAGRAGITAFLVPADRAGLRRAPMPGVELGHRGSDHAELQFDGVEVGPPDVVGAVGDGLAVAQSGLHVGRLSVAAGAVGIHRAALAAALDWTRRREQFSARLLSFQMVQERIADMTAELQAARALVHACARRRAAGTELPADLAIAKLYATEAAARACDQALQLLGARGYSTEQPVERLLRDVQALRIYEGTTLIQKSIVARALGGR
jgi:alkylation response protein AidB-like acyl-CoA dehydrogenase